jgi:signal transduction histidine kinase
LQPGALHKLGLVPAVQDLIHRVRTDDGPKITFSQSGVEKSLDVRISLNVYRIVQELLNNALKHAEANEISINLTQSEDTFSLSVQDDGKGYEPGSTARMGMGTENIASRVNYLKADLGIHTVLEEGTTTQIDIPLKN